MRCMKAGGHILIAVVLTIGPAAAAEKYHLGVGLYANPPGSTSPGACTAAAMAYHDSPSQACLSTPAAMSACDRVTATYRNYVPTLTSPSSCYLTWEYQNVGSTSWNSFGGTVPILECPENWKPRPSSPGCAAVKEIPIEQPPLSCPAGNPIYPLSGVKRDHIGMGISLQGVEFSLTYDTTPKARPSGAEPALAPVRGFGPLWSSSFHKKLMIVGSNKAAMVSRGNGYVVSFDGSSGSLVASGNVPHRLASVSGGYLFSDVLTGVLETYDTSGRLRTVSKPSGEVLTFHYGPDGLSAVEASNGRVTEFIYGAGLVSQIVAPDGGRITLGYDAARNLTSITWQNGKVLGLLYEDPNHPWALTGKVDENGSRLSTYAYDVAGRAISTEQAGGAQAYSVTYGSPPEVTSSEYYDATDDIWVRTVQLQAPSGAALAGPTGNTSELGGIVVGGRLALTSSSQPAGSGCAAASSSRTYDASGNLLSVDDFSGVRTCYSYDAGREVMRAEGLSPSDSCTTMVAPGASLPSGARRIESTWHADWNLATKNTRPLNAVTAVFHGQPDPFNGGATASCTSAPARTDGKPIPLVCKEVEQALLLPAGTVDSSVTSRVNAFTYDSAGRVLTSVNPAGQTTTFAYYPTASYSHDPHADKVVLLLHGNGTNGSTTVTDSGSLARTFTAAANAQVSTTQSKFGGASISFDGSGDYVSTPYDPALAYGSADFTIETFIYKNADTGTWVSLWSPTNGSYEGVGLWIDATGNFGVYLSTSGSSWTYSNAAVANLANGQWHHLAVVRSGGSVFAFVNGIMKPAITTALGTTALYNNTTTGRSLGGISAANYTFNGYIDEFRITKGVARYTADFTPPAAEFGPTINSVGHAAGDLQTVTNAAGHATTYDSYDPAGRVRQITDPNRVVTSITYTPRGLVSTVTVTPYGGSARVTTYAYDDVGQLTGVTNPDGTSLTYTYDAAHRMTGATDTRGNTLTYTLDTVGNRIGEEVRDPGGTLRRSISRSFDALNRLQQVTGAPQ